MQNPCVIIVDDNDATIDILRKICEKFDLNVIAEAKDGIKAVELFRKFKPDLMLLDLNVPLKSGLEALFEIKDEISSTCVINTATTADLEQVKECLSLGASYFIKKDNTSEKIAELISSTWDLFKNNHIIISENKYNLDEIIKEIENDKYFADLYNSTAKERNNEQKIIPDLLEDLYLFESDMEKLKKLSKYSNGLFLVSGTASSDKITTLYSILKYLSDNKKKVMTFEYDIQKSISEFKQLERQSYESAQMHIDELERETKVLAYINQLDPSIIEALYYASIRKLTFFTVNANSTFEAISSLSKNRKDKITYVDLMVGTLHQKSVKRLCDKCKEKYEPEDSFIHRFFDVKNVKNIYFYRPIGCNDCDNIGYKDTMPLYEIYKIDEGIQKLFNQNADINCLNTFLIEQGLTDIRYDGIRKALCGLTSIEEVVKLL